MVFQSKVEMDPTVRNVNVNNVLFWPMSIDRFPFLFIHQRRSRMQAWYIFSLFLSVYIYIHINIYIPLYKHIYVHEN